MFAATTADDPPRLADPAPSAAPVADAQTREYPPQFRGGYDPNGRLLGVLALVSPLLTTVLGFYFGQRAGEAGTRAVQAQAEQDRTQIANVALTKAAQNRPASELLEELRSRGLVKG